MLVSSVFPRMGNALHRKGPGVISTIKTIAAACRDSVAAQRGKPRRAGKRMASDLIRWCGPTDQSSGIAETRVRYG
jgi:hypothetical protein